MVDQADKALGDAVFSAEVDLPEVSGGVLGTYLAHLIIGQLGGEIL